MMIGVQYIFNAQTDEGDHCIRQIATNLTNLTPRQMKVIIVSDKSQQIGHQDICHSAKFSQVLFGKPSNWL